MMIDLGYDSKRCQQGLDAARRLVNHSALLVRARATDRIRYWEAQLAHAQRRESGEGIPVPETPAPATEEVSRRMRADTVTHKDNGADYYTAGVDDYGPLHTHYSRIRVYHSDSDAALNQAERIAHLVNNDEEFPW